MEWLLVLYIEHAYNTHFEYQRFADKQSCEKVKTYVVKTESKTNPFGTVVYIPSAKCISVTKDSL